jgi:hypothetical protein
MKLVSIFYSLWLFALLATFNSCKTDDVTPLVNLEVQRPQLDEEGTLDVFAVLNGSVNTDVFVKVEFSGNATLNQDYTTSSDEIVIPKGSERGSITLSGIQNNDTNIRFVEISISSVENGISLTSSKLTIELVDCSSDRDGDGIPDCEDDCPDEPGPPENNGCPWRGLVINEVLYDPPSGINGDSNKDGVRQPQEDEFIEIYNDGPELNISRYTISDDDMMRHTFPDGTIVPQFGVVLVFGGGSPADVFGDAIVQISSTGRLSFNRGGDVITIRDKDGEEIGVFDINLYEERAAQSYTRNPDIKGDYQQHSTIPEANGALYSAGTKLDGSRF